MLENVDAVADRIRRVVGMAEHQEARLMRFLGRELVGAGEALIVLREPRHVGLGLRPVSYRLADVGLGGAGVELRPGAGVEQPRQVMRVLAARAQRLGQVVEREDRGHAMVDQHLAHEWVPVHMRIEQPRDDELAGQVDHLRARRRGGVRGQHVANGVALD